MDHWGVGDQPAYEDRLGQSRPTLPDRTDVSQGPFPSQQLLTFHSEHSPPSPNGPWYKPQYGAETEGSSSCGIHGCVSGTTTAMQDANYLSKDTGAEPTKHWSCNEVSHTIIRTIIPT